jgi:ATP-binding cassette subfamily B protein
MTESTVKTDRRYVRRLLAFGRPYLGGFVVGILLLLLQVVSTNAMPLLIKKGIDLFLLSEETTLDSAARIEGLQKLCTGLVGLVAGMLVFRVSHAYVMTWVGQHVLRDLRLAVFNKVLFLPMKRFDQLRVGRLMTRATSDLDALQTLLQNGVVGMIANLLLLIGAMVFMLILEWRLALALFAVFPVLLGMLTWVNRNSRRTQREARKATSALNATTQEVLSGLFTLQVFGQREPMRERLTRQSDDVVQVQLRLAGWGTWHFPVLEVSRALAVCLLLLACGFYAPEQVGSLVAFLYYIRYFFRPLEELAEQSQALQSGLASAERVFDLLDEEDALPEPEVPEPMESIRGDIDFDRVTFWYDEGTPVIRNLSFQVKAGQFVAVVGATGAGKSTLLNLLCRFYDVNEGAVRIDGVDVREVKQEDLRHHLGLVQQDPMLFSGTVADNIGLGRPGVDAAQIEAAARRVNAHGFIENLKDGYQTDLGEGGFRLSTGQKQLIALARVLLQNADVLLMLDEATASVDSETEALIQAGLDEVRNGRTCFAIAHRLSTIQHADLILVLRHGELMEQGTHAELLARDGYYRTLVEAMRIGLDV